MSALDIAIQLVPRDLLHMQPLATYDTERCMVRLRVYEPATDEVAQAFVPLSNDEAVFAADCALGWRRIESYLRTTEMKA